MRRKPLVQRNKYFSWGTDKLNREVYWHKSNWQLHVDRHEAILTDENIFREALLDPDYIYPSMEYKDRSCYYKVDAFKKLGGTAEHAQVVICEDIDGIVPRPSNRPFVIVTTAMNRKDIPEQGKIKPKFVKKK